MFAMLAALPAWGQYSQNVVGYINVWMRPGWTVVVNQLGTTNSSANYVMNNGAPADGSLLYRFDPVAQDYFPAGTYLTGVGWYPPSGNTNDAVLNLPLGEGFFVWSPRWWTNTFVGEVRQGALSNPLPLNYSMKGSIVPQSGLVQSTLQFPPHDGDIIWRGVPATFTGFNYEDGNWSPNEPTINVGEGFFVFRTVANVPWTRNFTVNRPAGPPPESEPAPGIVNFAIRDGSITLKVDKVTKRYNVQYSTDREHWTTVAANQTATTWRGDVPSGPRGFWQVVKP
jgi:hypothetical protein